MSKLLLDQLAATNMVYARFSFQYFLDSDVYKRQVRYGGGRAHIQRSFPEGENASADCGAGHQPYVPESSVVPEYAGD